MQTQLLRSRLDRFRRAMQLAASIGVVLVLVLLIRPHVPVAPAGAAAPPGTAATQPQPAFGFPTPVRTRITGQMTRPVLVCSLREQV